MQYENTCNSPTKILRKKIKDFCYVAYLFDSICNLPIDKKKKSLYYPGGLFFSYGTMKFLAWKVISIFLNMKFLQLCKLLRFVPILYSSSQAFGTWIRLSIWFCICSEPLLWLKEQHINVYIKINKHSL